MGERKAEYCSDNVGSVFTNSPRLSHDPLPLLAG